MGETSPDAGVAADPDEAAFQRLAEGLAALRRDSERLRDPAAGPAVPQNDPQALAAALSEINRRIDAVAARAGSHGDAGPILAALAVVEEKIGTLTTGLDRFAERSALTEALAKVDSKIDSLAARLDARLNRLQDVQADLGARLKPSVPVPGAKVERTPERTPERTMEPRRSSLPAWLLLAVIVIGAVGALAWLRPDLIKPDWIRHEWVEPARDTVKRWLRLTQATPEQSLPQAVALASDVLSTDPVSPGQPGGTKVEVLASVDLAPPPENLAQEKPPVAKSNITVFATVSPAPADTVGLAPRPAALDPAITPGVAAAPLPGEPLPAAPASAAPPTPRLVLGAKADAWLMVRGEDGHILLARTLHEGETWKVPDLPGLRLTTGNAAATILLIDGVALPILGGIGGVRRDMPLDPGLLAAGLPPARVSGTKGPSETASR